MTGFTIHAAAPVAIETTTARRMPAISLPQ